MMQRNWQRAATLAAILAIASAGRAEAAFLVGTTATSPGIAFGASAVFAFDRASAVIADPGVEFTYRDAANTDTFDFADATVRVTDVTNAGSVASVFVASFADVAFLGATVSAASDGFPGLTAEISGRTLTITSSAGIGAALARSAAFAITPAPAAGVAAPSSLALSGIAAAGGGAIALARRPRRRSAAG